MKALSRKEIKVTNRISGATGFVYEEALPENGLLRVLTINGWVRWAVSNCEIFESVQVTKNRT